MKKLIKAAGLPFLVLSLAACNSSSNNNEVEQESDVVASNNVRLTYLDEVPETPFEQIVNFKSGSAEVHVYYNDEDYKYVTMGREEWHTMYDMSFEYELIKPLVNHIENNNGKFYEDWDHSFALIVEVRGSSQPYETWQEIEAMLEKHPDVFSHYKNGEVFMGPVTVILSGKTDQLHNELESTNDRYAFLDGSIDNHLGVEENSTLMPLVTSNFSYFNREEFGNFFGKGEWPAEALQELERITELAHSNNQKVRFYYTPEGEDEVDDKIWSELNNAGVDFVRPRLFNLDNFNSWMKVNNTEYFTPTLDWSEHYDWHKNK
ncbi:hypothetical protein L4D09_11425 [Photobacterium makurazakiensis]|uniref:hypothetical protein n=1 Tax=Photobacterium makurazakiensis TaxID=2910234 RepID=UPI003D0F970A